MKEVFMFDEEFMSLEICPKCEERLISWGSPAADMFADICRNYAHEKAPMELYHSNNREFNSIYTLLAFLERRGYLLSTECKEDCLLVKPLGFMKTEHGYFVCVNRNHSQHKIFN